MSLEARLPECTINYCKTLWKAKRIGDDGDPKHSCVLAFDAGTDLSELEGLLKEAAHEKFGKDIPAKAKWPLQKGEDAFPGKPEFAGKMVLSSATGEPPTMVKRLNGALVPILDHSELYAGCRVQGYVGIAAYDMKVNKGVGVYVNGILKIADGENLEGGKREADSMFDAEGADTVEKEIVKGDGGGDSTPVSGGNVWDS